MTNPIEKINKQAGYAKDHLSGGLYYDDGDKEIMEALVAASELLQQVVVLEEGEKAQKDDVIDLGEFGFAIVTAVSGNNIDCALLRDGQLMTGYFFRNFGKYKIIQRNGKPVITTKAGE